MTGLEVLPFLFKLVEWLGRLFAWVKGARKGRMEDIEPEILNYLAERRQWVTPGLIWAELFVLPILRDVRFEQAFPPPGGTWVRLKWMIANVKVNARHRWRMWRHHIPERVVVKATRRLWREGKLARAGWDELYQMRGD